MHHKKVVQNSHYIQESKKKRKNIRKRKIIIFFLLFALALAGLTMLLRWSKLNIQNIEITGNPVVDSTDLENTIKNEIYGYYLWIFPKSNFLIYPKNDVKAALEDNYKVLKNISLGLKGISTMELKVEERIGKYTWCGDTPQNDTNDNCYFMDDTGYIFGQAPFFSGDVYLKFYGKVRDDVSAPLGEIYFKEFFPKLLQFRDTVKLMGISTSAYHVRNDGSAELYLVSNTPFPNKQKIIFNPSEDLSKLAENLQTALATDPLKTDFKNKFSSFEYIDLRFGNKVYYKFRNE